MSAATFEYRVRDALGKEHEGTVDAQNQEDAVQILRRDGFQVIEIEEGGGGGILAPGIKRTDIIYLTCQLAIMVDTGITLSTALQGILEQEKNLTLRKILVEMRKSVESGGDFSEALAKHPKYFDKTYVSMIKVGEATGTLAEMLERVALYLRKEMEMRSKVKSAMAYPAIMAFIAISVTIFLLTYILPQFSPLFAKKGMKLPGPTKISMALSDALIHHWYWWIAGIVGLIVCYVWGRRTPQGRKIWDSFVISAPLIGSVTRKVVISRSLRTLGTMLNSGLSMLEALKLTAEVSGNYYYEQLWLKVLDEVTQGNEICESLRTSSLFPPMIVQMISAGEQTAQLGQVLEKVSNYYDHEVESSIKTATGMIEPILISVMGVVVGTIGLALLLPVFSLSKAP
ncbi:MAG: type II secretion system F family protein [Planctomycetia bacterium]|nr:type II secretion system F family protein [Planctomycetia bacterium]